MENWRKEMKSYLELSRHINGHLFITAHWKNEDDLVVRAQVISLGRDCHDNVMKNRFQTLCDLASEDVTIINLQEV